MRRAITAVTGCALAATLTLAACGSSGRADGDASAATLLTATADKTAAAKNARVSLEESVSSGSRQVEITGDGVVDFKKQAFHLLARAKSNPEVSIEEVVLGSKLYIKLPESQRASLKGKSWLFIDVQRLTGQLKQTALDGVSQDPTAFLSALKSVSNNVQNLGSAKVRGVTTTHYRAEVDLDKAAKLRGARPGALDQYKALTKSSVLPEDVYLDDEGRTRRISLALGSKDSSAIPLIDMTMDFYDFGKADTSGIAAPPKADTIDAADVPGFAGSGLGG